MFTKRKRISTQSNRQYTVKRPYCRLWFTGTNTFSETLYLNSGIFSRYSADDKEQFTAGQPIVLRENNKDVKAIILALGLYEKMEALEALLQEMADENADTQSILEKVGESIDIDLSSDEENCQPPTKSKRESKNVQFHLLQFIRGTES